ncbi:hypothetical protein N8J89_30930 [Crossiella sp. CA-258035]|uniref:hypothetical protein n=1 Tax=Crossiella sp. CA-258035 TaxID=2981138 RepID=UPI0024BD4723|nr:hypothetical protein [Crossiella sp. CA-258035]WHT17515.1 hypothetical protein N8J89_30930 [Crossiella sp. CA-258035]
MRRSGKSALRVLAVALIGVVTFAGGAAAEPTGPAVKINYSVEGQSVVKKTGSTLPLGPGALSVDLNAATGDIKGDLTLPPAHSEFKVFGLIPVTATIEFLPQGQTTGKIVRGVVTSSSQVVLRLRDVKAGGIPYPVGDKCQSKAPMTIDLTSEPGFNPLTGGKLSGAYTIPEFSNCHLAELLINFMIPGPDNTISLNLKRVV